MNASRSARAFLLDILWAQYCLYLAVRIKDDLLDGQVKDTRLSFAADEFARAAGETLLRHFMDNGEFWNYHRRCVRTTLRGIHRVRILQKNRTAGTRGMTHGYAETSSIFKVGIAAVCIATGHQRLLRRLGRAVDRIAIGSQILDDVRDILEDLNQGRLNYAARSILRRVRFSPDVKSIRLALLRRLIQPGPLEDVIAEASRHMEVGYSLLKRSLPSVIPACKQGTAALRHDLHRRRVELLFGGK
jgi:hypothetical protein